MNPLLLLSQVDKVLEVWKQDMDLAGAGIGFMVLDAKTGSVLAEHQPKLSLVPASTLKVLTTYAALGKLGLNYRFETRLFYTGTFDSITGVLDGDLIILGHGDPSLQSEFFSKDNQLVTDKWAKSIKERGIREIKGKVIGDASYFERSIPDEWIWGDISNYYGAAACGLSFADNKFRIDFQTGPEHSEARLLGFKQPYATQHLTIQTQVIAEGTSDKAVVYGDPYGYSRLVKGTLPPNKKSFSIEASLPDPALLCAEQLCRSLKAFGISCKTEQAESRYEYSESGDTRQFLFSHFSPPLEALVAITNQRSNNHYCESILRALGKGDPLKGLAEVADYWKKRTIDLSSLNMKDGCGLARANTCSAEILAKALYRIHNDFDFYKAFNASLPVAGKNGSMSNIGKGKWIENNLRAKTGYMDRVRSYAGYVKSKSGRELCFAILVNQYNCSASAMKEKIEKFFLALETY